MIFNLWYQIVWWVDGHVSRYADQLEAKRRARWKAER